MAKGKKIKLKKVHLKHIAPGDYVPETVKAVRANQHGLTGQPDSTVKADAKIIVDSVFKRRK